VANQQAAKAIFPGVLKHHEYCCQEAQCVEV
jgi:hypothetical protein